jgi:hypothetical protein
MVGFLRLVANQANMASRVPTFASARKLTVIADLLDKNHVSSFFDQANELRKFCANYLLLHVLCASQQR